MKFFLLVFVSPRENRRQERAKSKYIFEMWVQIVQVSPALLGCIYRVHLGMCAGSLCYFADVSKIGQDTAGCSAFYPLCRFVLGALSLNMALFRVLRAFLARFWGCCVGLCCSGALRGLWGFVRVWS